MDMHNNCNYIFNLGLAGANILIYGDYFDYVIPLLEKDYHLIIPAHPGYDPENKSDFTSIEEVAEK